MMGRQRGALHGFGAMKYAEISAAGSSLLFSFSCFTGP